jgi:hypothetical protein
MTIITDILAAATNAKPLDVTVRGSKDGTYTAYGVHSLINQTLKSLGSDLTVSPQTLYGYARTGLINGKKVEKVAGVRFTEDEAVAFVARYVKAVAANEVENLEDPELDESDESDEDIEIVDEDVKA